MEASNEPADDPFPRTTSKGSFAPTEIKGNDDTLKISKKSGYDLFWDTLLYVFRDFSEYSTEYGRNLLWIVIGAFRNRLYTKPHFIDQMLRTK
ncbi:hypothetical protein CEXT_179371 [Caerostris extrusa]|uniref:Uncharacterized protein n=1 Tax=Caerostris extrusa TaxID=172846 RepID=A0AAV4VK24_CAEEX|nr:hypothetical protein CEXT_179371 [Caerostris extrusa]